MRSVSNSRSATARRSRKIVKELGRVMNNDGGLRFGSGQVRPSQLAPCAKVVDYLQGSRQSSSNAVLSMFW